MFSSVAQLLVSQWTTPLNELMSRSGSSLKTDPQISLISYQLLRGVTVLLYGPFRYGVNRSKREPTSGRPRMTSSEANVCRVKDILEVNSQMSVQEIVDNLSLSRSTVHRILKGHLSSGTSTMCGCHMFSLTTTNDNGSSAVKTS